MTNNNLGKAKAAKNDEFYTQYSDIQKEIEAYLEYDSDTFRGKVVYSNCDDPFESNFFRYFALKFNDLGLKRLITTSYKPSPIANTQLGLFGDDKTIPPARGRPKITANKLIINEVGDMDGDGAFNLSDIMAQLKANKNNEWTPLEGDGDFQSAECIELLKQADIVITNPPFSLFREYIKQLFDYDKRFLIIANKNLITKKEVFPLFKDNKMWSGRTSWSGGMWFQTNNSDDVDKVIDGVNMKNVASIWLTNLDHGRRHQLLNLMTMSDNLKFNKKMKRKTAYDRYANYDAIEVPFTDAIPSDYNGEMGVPLSFLDKYNPDQFEIVGVSLRLGKSMSSIAPKGAYQQGGPSFYLANGNGNYKRQYDRIVIKHRKAGL